MIRAAFGSLRGNTIRVALVVGAAFILKTASSSTGLRGSFGDSGLLGADTITVTAIIAAVCAIAMAVDNWRLRRTAHHHRDESVPRRDQHVLDPDSNTLETQRRLNLALVGAGIGTWDWNLDTGSLRFDATWASMLGYELHELEQHVSVLDCLMHPDDLVHFREVLHQNTADPVLAFESEVRMHHRSGHWRWILTRGRLCTETGGQTRQVWGTSLDITQRRRDQDAIARSNAELQRSNQELEDFAYIASHDLQEPLRGIRNYANFLLEDYDGKLDADGQAKLHTLVRLSRRLEEFLDALLHYSRVGREELAFAPVDIQEQIAHVVESLQLWLLEKNAIVECEETLPCAWGSAVQIGEVFRNLITNGVKYNDQPQPRIRIEWMPNTAHGPAYVVRDNGIGIADRHKEDVFRIFRRLHGRDMYGGGTGAGLTIVKRIIERHGGRIWFESTIGQGTSAFVVLKPEA